MKFNSIFSIVTGSALMLGLAACTDEIKYTPAPEVNGEGLYFPAEFPATYDIAADETVIPIEVYRTNGSAEETVQISGGVTVGDESAADVFGVPASVTFAAGANAATLNITVDFDKLEAETEYSLSLALPEGNDTPYGPSSLTSTLIYAPWSEYVEQETYVSFWYGTPFDGNGSDEWYWFKAVSLIDPKQWKVVVPAMYSNLPLDLECTINENESNSFLNENNELCYYVTTPIMDCGYPEGASPTYGLADYYSWLVWIYSGTGSAHDFAMRNLEKDGQTRSYYNSVSGLIVLNTQLFPYGEDYKGRYYQDAFGVYTIQLPGYTVPYIDIFDGGSVVDATGLEKKVFQIQKASNVATMKFQLLEGEISGQALDAAYAELAANEDIAAVEESSITATYEIEYGVYTMIAVGFDSNKKVLVENALTLDYKGVQPPSTWKTLGYVDYTDGFMQTYDKDVPKITIKAKIQEDSENPGSYRLVNPYRTWIEEVNAGAENPVFEATALAGNYYVYFNAADERMVYVSESNIGLQIDRADGPIYVNSVAQQLLDEGRTPGVVRLQSGRMRNGVITFPINKLLTAPKNTLPDWQEANKTQAFSIDMNSLSAELPADAPARRVEPIGVNMKHQRNFRIAELGF